MGLMRVVNGDEGFLGVVWVGIDGDDVLSE